MCYDYEGFEKCMTFTILILDRVFLCACVCTPTYTYTFALFLVFPPYPLYSLIFLVCSCFVVPHLRFKFSLDLKNLTGHFFLVLSNNSSFLDLT